MSLPCNFVLYSVHKTITHFVLTYLIHKQITTPATNTASVVFIVGLCTFLPKGKKVKCTPVQALKLCTGLTAHRGSRDIALPFHDHGTRRGEGSASRPGRSIPPRKTRYPLYRRLGGLQGRSGQVRKI